MIALYGWLTDINLIWINNSYALNLKPLEGARIDSLISHRQEKVKLVKSNLKNVKVSLGAGLE